MKGGYGHLDRVDSMDYTVPFLDCKLSLLRQLYSQLLEHLNFFNLIISFSFSAFFSSYLLIFLAWNRR